MPPKKARKKSAGTEKSGRGCGKATPATLARNAQAHGDTASDADLGEAGESMPRAPARVVWDKYPVRTERLLDYLDTHTDVALKLFGDSTKAAKSESWPKVTAKSSKGTAYLQLAEGIFSIDEDPAIRSDFTSNPTKYAKAVDNYITNSLKKQYRAANERIGKTGAGLNPEDVTPGSDIANIIEKETENFRWWPRLHGFWRTLPNFNPYTVSSEPGQDLAAEAASVLMPVGGAAGGHRHRDSDMDESAGLGSPSLFPDVEADFSGSTPAKFNHLRNDSLTSSTLEPFASTTSSSKAPSSAQKSRTMTKRGVKDHFSEDAMREDEMLKCLRKQKHERMIANQELKRRKLDHKLLEAQHQCEREREQHELRMLQMRMMMDGQRATGASANPVMQSAQPRFEGLGLMDELNGDGNLLSGPSTHSHYSI